MCCIPDTDKQGLLVKKELVSVPTKFFWLFFFIFILILLFYYEHVESRMRYCRIVSREVGGEEVWGKAYMKESKYTESGRIWAEGRNSKRALEDYIEQMFIHYN